MYVYYFDVNSRKASIHFWIGILGTVQTFTVFRYISEYKNGDIAKVSFGLETLKCFNTQELENKTIHLIRSKNQRITFQEIGKMFEARSDIFRMTSNFVETLYLQVDREC